MYYPGCVLGSGGGGGETRFHFLPVRYLGHEYFIEAGGTLPWSFFARIDEDENKNNNNATCGVFGTVLYRSRSNPPKSSLWTDVHPSGWFRGLFRHHLG